MYIFKSKKKPPEEHSLGQMLFNSQQELQNIKLLFNSYKKGLRKNPKNGS